MAACERKELAGVKLPWIGRRRSLTIDRTEELVIAVVLQLKTSVDNFLTRQEIDNEERVQLLKTFRVLFGIFIHLNLWGVRKPPLRGISTILNQRKCNSLGTFVSKD